MFIKIQSKLLLILLLSSQACFSDIVNPDFEIINKKKENLATQIRNHKILRIGLVSGAAAAIAGGVTYKIYDKFFRSPNLIPASPLATDLLSVIRKDFPQHTDQSFKDIFVKIIKAQSADVTQQVFPFFSRENAVQKLTGLKTFGIDVLSGTTSYLVWGIAGGIAQMSVSPVKDWFTCNHDIDWIKHKNSDIDLILMELQKEFEPMRKEQIEFLMNKLVDRINNVIAFIGYEEDNAKKSDVTRSNSLNNYKNELFKSSDVYCQSAKSALAQTDKSASQQIFVQASMDFMTSFGSCLTRVALLKD